MNNTVFITGASSGFGRATARYFAAQGWNVVATMRAPEQETELTQLPNVLVTQLDVEQPATISAAVAAGLARFGQLDVLVNNAGFGTFGIFESASYAQIRRQFDVNVFGLMAVTQAVLPHFRAQHSGTIINISSFGGRVAVPVGSIYNASKFAVEGFSESLSYELAALGVGVKIIEPGGVATNFGSTSAEVIHSDLPEYAPVTSTFRTHYGQATGHLPRSTAEDVAQVIYQAATDGTSQLRYVVGADAEHYLQARQTASDQEYLGIMRGYFPYFSAEKPA
jgi:NAD(P)-dependent dehydrogenase (short-subunit alcohol dehydrogenase family)